MLEKFHRIKSLVSCKRFVLSLVMLSAVIASIQSLSLDNKIFEGQVYTAYNNYNIFTSSFHHLTGDRNLYNLHPEEHLDLFKYSPTFAVFFGLFALLPTWAGLLLWNMLNALLLAAAVYYLPNLSKFQKGFIILLSLIELTTHLQNEQSNALIAGLIIFAFGLMERKKLIGAALLIAITVYIKLFGLLAFVLFVFYPGKWKATLYSLLWMFVFFAVPLIFITPTEYFKLLSEWIQLIITDHASSYGLSLMGVIHTWFELDFEKLWILIPGLLWLLFPLINTASYKNYGFRLLMLSSLLVWMVIFNHKAESPTFILAITGTSIWFALAEKNLLNISLILFAIVFTSLSPTDIFPVYLRENFFTAFALKAVPCILIWVKITFDMLWYQEKKYATSLKM